MIATPRCVARDMLSHLWDATIYETKQHRERGVSFLSILIFFGTTSFLIFNAFVNF